MRNSTRNSVVDLQRLLEELADISRMSKQSDPAYRVAHSSSHDPSSLTPAEPEGWFGNNDSGNFIRTENHGGRTEYVIADFLGPGCLCRVWAADRRLMPRPDLRTEEKAVVRLYFDGESTPAVEGHFHDLFNGTGPFPYPFAHRSLSSAVSYFPVPFATGLKITLDSPPQWYNITARIYEQGTPVRTFSVDELRELEPMIGRLGRTLSAYSVEPETRTTEKLHLGPGESSSFTLDNGPAAINELSLVLDRVDSRSSRGMVLSLSFDGAQTAFCPVGELYGCGVGHHPFTTMSRSVTGDGRMSVRWPMPYQKRAEVSLLNLDDAHHECEVRIGTDRYEWNDASMYFHAGWRYAYPVATRPYSDWNYVTVEGSGRYVGDTLTVHNPVQIWWGEGDEKVWVDDDRFPSVFGTGTEDYYGYAWGGMNRGFYEHPLHAQVRVDRYDKNWTEQIPLARDTRGLSTELRNLVLDSVPFRRRLQYDMEVWHWESCEMTIASSSFVYARPGARFNHQHSPEIVRESLDRLGAIERGG
jgi:hypothetical protein